MKILIWAGIVFAAVAAVGFIFFIFVFYNMIFISKITERKVLKEKDYAVLLSGVVVEAVKHELPPLEREWKPGAGDIAAAREVLLAPDNSLSEEHKFFDGEPSREVLQLDSSGGLPSKIYIGHEIYDRNGDKLGRKTAEFNEAPFDGPRYIGGVNGKWFLLAGAMSEIEHVEVRLWQVNHATLEMQQIEQNPYYTFSRPPKTFEPDGFPGVIVAIYQGDVSYGFGGNSSRPASTILRAYTREYPDGVDLAQFFFKAGTVVEVDWIEGALVG